MLRNKSFHGIYLDALFPSGNAYFPPKIQRERKLVWQYVQDGIKSGVVQPLPTTIFDIDQVEDAFRYMATGKHIGKVVIKVRDEEVGQLVVENPRSRFVMAIPTTQFHPQKSYIIAGGLGGMGLELMYWMWERGATKFILTSRRGIISPTQQFAIKRLRERNCQIYVLTDDATTVNGATEILRKAQLLGPIGGIFILTLVLQDNLIENQTVEKFKKVINAKSVQAEIFDELTRKITPKLDFFVGFSSASCGRGIAGQSNYAYTNSIMERICERRRYDGHHGLAVQWGMIGDVGVVAETFGAGDNANKVY
jgi:fatty acid synthase, animal type